MSFESINELDKFTFDDCQITGVEIRDDSLIFTMEALIVGAKNSQNTNYTESYADTTTLILRGMKIDEFMEEGYKLYDAQDKLIDEIDDKVIEEKDYKATLKALVDGYMFNAECMKMGEGGYTYSFEIDMSAINEDGLVDPYSTTYQLIVTFEESRVTWERYLNRVQK